jgi:hypothetical protein
MLAPLGFAAFDLVGHALLRDWKAPIQLRYA